MSGGRRRLDQALVARGLASSRSRARALIMAGRVRVTGQVVSKPATAVGDDDEIDVEAPSPFVSRGGEKLAAALRAAKIDVTGRTCIDIGASTGGFTDCLLQQGAAAVAAVDVGYGQLDYRLRQDPRVVVLERINARYLRADDLPETIAPPSLLVMDIAFIGAGKVLPAVGSVCAACCEALVLVKPQFECGPQHVGEGGIVRSAAHRREALARVATAAARLGWGVEAAMPSPLRGQAGNWECFLNLRRPRRSGEFASLHGIIDRIDVPEG